MIESGTSVRQGGDKPGGTEVPPLKTIMPHYGILILTDGRGTG